jgi:hypothetical protein
MTAYYIDVRPLLKMTNGCRSRSRDQLNPVILKVVHYKILRLSRTHLTQATVAVPGTNTQYICCFLLCALL